MSSDYEARHAKAVEDAINRNPWDDDPLTVAQMAGANITEAQARLVLDALAQAGWTVVRVVDAWIENDENEEGQET